jgi:DNA-binding transcriptional MerR regulator
MRISELSRRTGVSVPTIKYYLRERLMPPGTPTARNQAEYEDLHVHRLRLIRTLREVGGLSVSQVGRVLKAVEDEQLPMHELLGVAHHALGPPPDPEPPSEQVGRARQDVERYLTSLGWKVSPEAPARRALADALVALRELRGAADPAIFQPYAEAAKSIATHELGTAPAAETRAAVVEWLVVGTVVFEAALVALRRLAQEHVSAETR